MSWLDEIGQLQILSVILSGTEGGNNAPGFLFSPREMIQQRCTSVSHTMQ